MSPVTQVFPNARSLTVNRRELLAVAWLATLLVSLIAFATVVAMYAFPQNEIFTLGKVHDFSETPTQISAGSQNFWVVITDGELYVFDPVTPDRWACRYRWVPSVKWFEDPCSGTKFALDGRWLEGPAFSGLRRYKPAILPDGTIQVNEWDKIPGAPLESKCQWEHYMSCRGDTGCQEVCLIPAWVP